MTHTDIVLSRTIHSCVSSNEPNRNTSKYKCSLNTIEIIYKSTNSPYAVYSGALPSSDYFVPNLPWSTKLSPLDSDEWSVCTTRAHPLLICFTSIVYYSSSENWMCTHSASGCNDQTSSRLFGIRNAIACARFISYQLVISLALGTFRSIFGAKTSIMS